MENYMFKIAIGLHLNCCLQNVDISKRNEWCCLIKFMQVFKFLTVLYMSFRGELISQQIDQQSINRSCIGIGADLIFLTIYLK